jgi:hypothetical protein
MRKQAGSSVAALAVVSIIEVVAWIVAAGVTIMVFLPRLFQQP